MLFEYRVGFWHNPSKFVYVFHVFSLCDCDLVFLLLFYDFYFVFEYRIEVRHNPFLGFTALFPVF